MSFRSVGISLSLPVALLAAAPALPARAAPEALVSAAREALDRHAREPFEQQSREAALRDLGRIGGEEAAKAVVSVLADPFEHLRDHAVSALVAMLRGPRADATEAWLVRAALGRRASASARRAAAIALGTAGRARATHALAAAAIEETDGPAAVAMCEACERLGDAAAVDALLPVLRSEDGRAVGAAARALGRAGSRSVAVRKALTSTLAHRHALARAGAVDGLVAADAAALLAASPDLLRDRAIEPRIAIADALGALPARERRGKAFGLLASLLADASWRVRAAACEAAVAVWDPASIPLLLERLRLETGRPRADVLRALRTLAGRDAGADADLWAAWWSTAGPGFHLGPRPEPDRFGRIRRPVGPPARGRPGETHTAAFFELPLASTRLAFLFDFSGSMRDPFDGGGGASKIDLARREFESAAKGLGKDVVYDLFLFRYPSEFPPAPRMTRALGALSPGGEASAKRAVAWLAKEQAVGWGAIYDGLVLCAAEEVDTIVLLSDGVPSRGTYERGDRLIEELAKANRFRRVAVDTVLVGTKGADRRFMHALSDATGGRFQDATKAGRPGR